MLVRQKILLQRFKRIDNFKWIDSVLGSGKKTVLDCEIISRREARRSLVLTRNMKKGEIIRKEDIMPKRPGTGISPQFAELVIGRKIKMDLCEDTILGWDMIQAIDLHIDIFEKNKPFCFTSEIRKNYIQGQQSFFYTADEHTEEECAYPECDNVMQLIEIMTVYKNIQ